MRTIHVMDSKKLFREEHADRETPSSDSCKDIMVEISASVELVDHISLISSDQFMLAFLVHYPLLFLSVPL